MTKNGDPPKAPNVWIWFAAIVAVSAVARFFVAKYANSDVKLKDGASALAFITVLAIAIERGIEMVWTSPAPVRMWR